MGRKEDGNERRFKREKNIKDGMKGKREAV